MSQALQSEKGKLYAVTCDITQEAQVKQAFQWVRENLGGVDILVNCAAVLGPDSILGTVSHMCIANIFTSIICFIYKNVDFFFHCSVKTGFPALSSLLSTNCRSIMDNNMRRKIKTIYLENNNIACAA